MSDDPPGSILLALHFWISVLRSLCIIPGIVLTFNARAVASEATGSTLAEASGYFHTVVIAMSSVVLLNDIFILTVDFWRTNTYIGISIVQGTISLVAVILAARLLKLLARWGAHKLAFYTPIVVLICSVLLLVLNLFAWYYVWQGLRPHVTTLVNVKDATLVNVKVEIRGEEEIVKEYDVIPIVNRSDLTWKGSARNDKWPAESLLRRSGATAAKKYIVNLFVRRVSPAETKKFAFIRNMFALCSMAFIIWRTVVALSQAKNKTEIRTYSAPCPSSYAPDFRILVYVKIGREVDVGITSTGPTTTQTDEIPCTPSHFPDETTFDWRSKLEYVYHVISFNCPSALDLNQARFNVRIISQNHETLVDDLPHIWLSDNNDNRKRPPTSGSLYAESSVPWFAPPWQLKPGFHLDANARFITRRFLISSVFRDIVLQKQSVYEEMSIYPINIINAVPLSDNMTATASVTLSLESEQSILRDRKVDDLANRLSNCDYVEEFISGTIFDVIGSIGGLFALFQSLHVMLFGRPLLWGFTGAKLIAPFGMLGSCSSNKFRERLRERYHRPRPVHDPDETIKVATFLRDFVIDFGPADVENRKSHTSERPMQGRM